jgi:hypothetical protein
MARNKLANRLQEELIMGAEETIVAMKEFIKQCRSDIFVKNLIFMYERDLNGDLDRSSPEVREFEMTYGIRIEAIFEMIETASVREQLGLYDKIFSQTETIPSEECSPVGFVEHDRKSIRIAAKQQLNRVDPVTLGKEGVVKNNFNKEKSRNGKAKSIMQYNKETDLLIRTYDSIKQAAKETGVHHNLIIDACKDRRESAGGFVWRYGK